MEQLAAVIFDMDGVLLDSEPLHFRAIREVLASRNATYTERDNQAFFGATDAELFRILRIIHNLEPSTEALVREKTEILIRLVREEPRPLPGVPEVPRRLKSQGIALALASSSLRPLIDAALDVLGLGECFGAVVSGEELLRGKPAPDAYLLAARRLGVEPAACLAVEDSRSGVLAAKAAGMTCVAIPCPATREQDFADADAVLASLEALPERLALVTTPARRG